MTAPINLSKMRKRKERETDRARADANAAKHGRTKAMRETEKADQIRRADLLDRHRLEDD